MIAGIMIGRRGSKGFPGKNTTEICGKPMCEWVLDAADKSCIDELYISTDDEDIIEIAAKYGATNIERPPHLCTDEALGEDVFIHAHNQIKDKKPDLVVLMFANAPTVLPRHIDMGVSAVWGNDLLGVNSACTVSRYNMYHPTRARVIRNNMVFPMYTPMGNCDRDSAGDVWFYDCSVAVVRPQNLDAVSHGVLPQRWLHDWIVPIRNDGGVDVDYEWQLGQVEWWLKENNRCTK